MAAPVIVWLRRDLRLADQPAFAAAAESGMPVIPVYVMDDDTPKHRRMGAASRWWLHHSLASIGADLRARGSRLILRRGKSDDALAAIARETGARSVHALHHHEPWWLNAQKAVACQLELVLHHGNYLAPPGSVLSGSGQPYRIYTPFWRSLCGQMPPAAPLAVAPQFSAPEQWPQSDALEDWGLLPSRPDWAQGFWTEWTPGEEGAKARLQAFMKEAAHYAEQRNLPGVPGTSRLSPHLHFGEMAPARVWHGVRAAGGSADIFLGELGWRDYADNIIHQFPDYGARSYKLEFEAFPWRRGTQADADFRAWCQGRTGYPIVDAGMRELWATGWMHNRVRMIVASFLIKHLMIDWRRGEQWFWDTLVDADYASNAVNWQWSAGSGVDANMFVRIMAPFTQSAKFEAGAYIRRWVPELQGMNDADIHDPGPLRPRSYPAPIIGHKQGRARAMDAWKVLKGKA